MRGGLQVPCTVVVRETAGGGGDSKFGLREVGRTPLTATYEGRGKNGMAAYLAYLCSGGGRSRIYPTMAFPE